MSNRKKAIQARQVFLDLDFLPVYNADNPKEYKFSGKRIKRGLYRSSDGRIVNADVNGVASLKKNVFKRKI